MNLSTTEAFKHIELKGDMVEVSGKRLEQLQGVLARMLKDIDMVCRNHDIAYTLSGGTCLGAIRHHGFIPWDDDVDINMPRSDFERFVRVMREEHSDEYVVHVPGETEGYELGLGRVRRRGTIVRSKEDFATPVEECGAYVDIFILEDVPDNAPARGAHGFFSLALGFALSCRRFAANRDEFMELAGDQAGTAATFKKKAALGRLFSFRSVGAWLASWNKWNSRCRNARSRFLSIPVGRKHYFGELYRREDFFPVSWGEFEGMRVPLPAHPEVYMEALYGPDYMTPPPEADREHHVVLEFDLGEWGESAGTEETAKGDR